MLAALAPAAEKITWAEAAAGATSAAARTQGGLNNDWFA